MNTVFFHELFVREFNSKRFAKRINLMSCGGFKINYQNKLHKFSLIKGSL